MRRRLQFIPAALLLSCAANQPPEVIDVRDGGVVGRTDVVGARTDVSGGRTDTGTPIGVCRDTDGDGLSDEVEGAPMVDTDRDGMPDYMDQDSDGDGFLDANEAARRYPNFGMFEQSFVCGSVGDNCDAPQDSVPNFRDLDADNDGLTDREEQMLGTNPCAADSDGDGATDLIEAAAMSDGRNPMSGPPANSLYVVLPYVPPGAAGMREYREFQFSTRIRQADVLFLVDNSASMEPIINNLRTNFRATIVPGVQAQIPDVRMGVASFDSMPFLPSGEPGSPGDYTLWVRQAMTPDFMAVQRAFDQMNTIDRDTGGRFVGGDGPENQTEAAYLSITGDGSPGRENDAAALRSVRNALDPAGNGWVPRSDPMRDCPRDGTRYGWACFTEGRVPILVLASDAPWYDGCVAGSLNSGGRGHNCNQLVDAMNMRGGYFIGVDVGNGVGGFTFTNARVVAERTRTVDGAGNPIVFGPGRNGIAMASTQIVEAITRVAGQSRQDITTRTQPDAMASGLPPMRSTADFIKAVVPLRGDPEPPTGYERRDATTFYSVSPSTRVTFRVEFFNDFAEGTTTARLYRATIEVLGRGGTVVDTRPVFIVIPAVGAGIGIPG
jgi:hypothetical protein